MLTITQIVGIVIAILLTGLFLILGYQMVLILQELKKSMEKVNQSLDDANRITKSVADPLVSLSGFLTGLKDGARLVSLFTDKFSKQEKKKHYQ